MLPTASQIFKMSSRRIAWVHLRLRARARVINLPPQNISARAVGLFLQVRANFPPQVQSSVLCTRRNPQMVLGVGGSMAAPLEMGKQMFLRQPGGVTSAHGFEAEVFT